MPDQSPLRGAEEGMGLDVRGAGAGAQAAVLVFDEELADEGFAEAGVGVSGLIDAGMGGWCLLGNLGVSGPFGEGYVVSQDIGKCCVSVLALEWGGAV